MQGVAETVTPEPYLAHFDELQVWATRTTIPWGEPLRVWSSFLTSLAIRAFTFGRYGGRYSHIGIRKGNLIYEATERGVQENLAEAYNMPCRVVDAWHIQVREVDESHILTWLCEQLGSPYDFGQLVKIALDILGKGGVWSDWLGSEHRYICSELVALAYMQVGVDISCDEPLWLVTPDHIRLFAQRNTGRVIERGRVTFEKET